MFLQALAQKSLSITVGQLTRTILFNLLCHDAKYTDNLNHDLHDRICHSSSQGNLYISLQPSEDAFHAREDIKEFTSTIANTFNGL